MKLLIAKVVLSALVAALYIHAIYLLHDAVYAWFARISDEVQTDVFSALCSRGNWEYVWFFQYAIIIFPIASCWLQGRWKRVAAYSMLMSFCVFIWTSAWLLDEFVYIAYAFLGGSH